MILFTFQGGAKNISFHEVFLHFQFDYDIEKIHENKMHKNKCDETFL